MRSTTSDTKRSLVELAQQHDTDKARHRHYLANYERHFSHLRNRNVSLLELGVHRGGSLLLWRDYFVRGAIAGLDMAPVRLDDASGRVHVFQGRQDDISLLDDIARRVAPNGFDIIIDDCAHVGVLARATFWHLFEHHLKADGIYVLEDWGSAYWDSWVDGEAYTPRGTSFDRHTYWAARALTKLASQRIVAQVPFLKSLLRRTKHLVLSQQFTQHGVGMVGFVKELIDECGSTDVTLPGRGRGAPRDSRIAEMCITLGHVVVRKRC